LYIFRICSLKIFAGGGSRGGHVPQCPIAGDANVPDGDPQLVRGCLIMVFSGVSIQRNARNVRHAANAADARTASILAFWPLRKRLLRSLR